MLLPTGAGQARDISVDGLHMLQRVGFLQDGRLLLVGAKLNDGARCFVRPLDGGTLKPITGEGVLECRGSPDSRQLAVYQSGDLWLYDIETGKGHAVPNAEHFLPIRWLNNQTILAAPLGEMPTRVFQIDATTGKQKLFKEVEPGDRAGVYQVTSLAASPDGKTIVYSYHQAIYDLYVVEGLK
jgi:hypothetical protein